MTHAHRGEDQATRVFGGGTKNWRPSLAGLAAFAVLVASSSPALALDKVTFGLNWLADPEAGGYYQAVVDGAYAKYGLDVTIQPGSPQSDGGLLLLVGFLCFAESVLDFTRPASRTEAG